ncbi:4'-phosphopantetheinyl transferase family protein [Solihabitans fulvus]|uniref:4'-phosphopantetheinyl transferase family protein n=1 Tax=Solihabitans fulvus TaxID=1892852 RepID=UPI001661936A|nr:4'-phosphopantetheinyl transferase superfamily protein [Solihabitans fulvus]
MTTLARRGPALAAVGSYRLAGGAVDLWLAPSRSTEDQLATEDLAELAGVTDERARAEFTAGRAALRRVLADYPIGLGPPKLAKDGNGRPYLVNAPGWDVNLSRAGSLVAVAVARGARIGVDIERAVPQPRAASLAARYFSSADRAALAEHDLASAEATLAWYRIWTRREAIAKATGAGLRGLAADVDGVELVELPMPEGYVGTLAALPEVQSGRTL